MFKNIYFNFFEDFGLVSSLIPKAWEASKALFIVCNIEDELFPESRKAVKNDKSQIKKKHQMWY